MNRTLLLIPCILAMGSLPLIAQNTGSIRGRVVDASTGIGMVSATVAIDGTTYGTATDGNGRYEIPSLPEGIYRIVVSSIGYTSRVIDDIAVGTDPVTLRDIYLVENVDQVAVVTVSQRALRSNETAIQTLKRKSLNTLDGISQQMIRELGDYDAGAALRRVTGVSVEEGRFLLVRGLGDRYSKVLLNNMEIPGLDPDRNSVALDLFPISLIDNLLVYKTFTPDLPAAFAGGTLNITTKDFPDGFTVNLNTSIGANPNVFLNTRFLSYQSGIADQFAFGASSRAVPSAVSQGIPEPTTPLPSEAAQLTFVTRSFDDNFLARETRLLQPDYDIALSIGSQRRFSGKTFGIIGSLTYIHRNSFYEDGIVNRFRAVEGGADLRSVRTATDSRSSQQALLGLLLNASYKFNLFNRVTAKILHNRYSDTYTRFQQGFVPVLQPNWAFHEHTVGYDQKSVTTFQLDGDHNFGNRQAMRVDWALSTSSSNFSQPDLRILSHIIESNPDGTVSYFFNSTGGFIPRRFFRENRESVIDAKANFTYNFERKAGGQSSGLRGNIRTGLASLTKLRNYSEDIYQFETSSNRAFFSGDPREYFRFANIWTLDNPTGVYVRDVSFGTNKYNGRNGILAGYATLEYPVSNRWKIVTGLRTEYADMVFSNQSDIPGSIYRNSILYRGVNFLPAAASVYELMRDRMNLRVSYGRTLAYPNFREIANGEFYDPVDDIFVTGNPQLRQTLVENVDLRWEYYMKAGEVVSLGGFYKYFNRPIELAFRSDVALNAVEYRNNDFAYLFGGELEIKKKLDFIWALRYFQTGINVTYIRSVVTLDSSELANIRALDPEASATRAMFGQPDFIANAYLSYNSPGGTNANLSFNVQGKRLYIVSRGGTPNVFTNPFPSLNLNVSQRLGKRVQLGLNCINLLDPKFRQVQPYRTAGGPPEDKVFREYSLGRSFLLTFSYRM